MKELEFTIVDPVGIHARPAGQLVKALKECTSTIKIATAAKEADIRRMMAVMGLGVKGGDTIKVLVDGADEAADAAKVEAVMKEIGLI